MEIQIEQHEHGIILPIKARPNARRNAIDGIHAGKLKVSVTATPEKGKANAAIVKILSKMLGIAKSKIELISGPTSSEKRFLLLDESNTSIQAALKTILNDK